MSLPAELPVKLLMTGLHLLAVVCFRAPIPDGDAARGGEVFGFGGFLNVPLAGAGRLDIFTADAPDFGRAGAPVNVDLVAQSLQPLREHGAVHGRPVLLTPVQLEGLNGLYFSLSRLCEIESEVMGMKIGRGEPIFFVRARGIMLEAGEE
jgi:hypothetical protein